MDSMGGGDNRNEQEYVEGLDDMVASFGDPMGSMVGEYLPFVVCTRGLC